MSKQGLTGENPAIEGLRLYKLISIIILPLLLSFIIIETATETSPYKDEE